MTPGQEMQVQEKRELQKNEESTIPVRAFVPTTDIYETDQALTVVMEMPGVEKANLDVHVENDVLNVIGHIDFSKYEICNRSIRNTILGTTGGPSVFRPITSIRKK